MVKFPALTGCNALRLLVLSSVACCGSVGAVLMAQGASQTPVFRSGADLIAIDVTAVDRDGKPVKGLSAKDFEVTVDGKVGVVRAVDYKDYSGTPTIPDAGGQNAPARLTQESQSRGGRVMLLVVDDLSAKPAQLAGLLKAAKAMLPTLDLNDLVGLATTSGLGPIVMPTRDREAIKIALESKDLVGRYDESTAPYYVSVPEALEINRVASNSMAFEGAEITQGTSVFARVILRECMTLYVGRGPKGRSIDETCEPRVIFAAKSLGQNIIRRATSQLQAYVRLINALGKAPAPRVMVALSAGIATGSDTGNLGEMGDVGLAAARAGVQFFALMEAPDPADAADISYERSAARRDEGSFFSNGVQNVAAGAGGEAFTVVGQADRFFKRIVSETSGVYQLGVEMAAVPVHDFVNVKVSTTRPGVIVRANMHALSPTAAPVSVIPIEEALQTRVAQGGAALGVPITLATAVRRDSASAKVQIVIDMQVPNAVQGPLIARFAVVDTHGRIVNEGRRPIPIPGPNANYLLGLAVALEPGTYRVRVAVADANGNIGSSERQVAASLLRIGSVSTSELLMTWSSVDGKPRLLAEENLPAQANTLRVSLELYPDDPRATSALRVRLALYLDGDAGVPIEQEVEPIGRGAVRIATASLPTAGLKVGSYTVKATIFQGGVATGSLSGRFRKIGTVGVAQK